MYSKLSNVTQKWVYVLLPFLSGYNKKYNPSQIASITKIPQQSVSRILLQLADAKIIDYKIEGKNKNYFLDLNNGKTPIIINILENFRTLEFSVNVPGKFYVINEMLNFCDSILLFGSYANDNFEENSDLDLVLVNCNNKEAIKKIKNREVMEINEHYVSYLDFKKSLKNKNNLAIEILKNHILFGNVSKIVEYYIEDGKR